MITSTFDRFVDHGMTTCGSGAASAIAFRIDSCDADVATHHDPRHSAKPHLHLVGRVPNAWRPRVLAGRRRGVAGAGRWPYAHGCVPGQENRLAPPTDLHCHGQYQRRRRACAQTGQGGVVHPPQSVRLAVKSTTPTAAVVHTPHFGLPPAVWSPVVKPTAHVRRAWSLALLWRGVLLRSTREGMSRQSGGRTPAARRRRTSRSRLAAARRTDSRVSSACRPPRLASHAVCTQQAGAAPRCLVRCAPTPTR